MSLAVSLDGTDVSGVAIEGSATRRLNRPAQATIKIPMDAAIGGPGSRLKISFNGSLFFHGMVMDCETDAGEDDGYTVYNASDPMELWNWRPVRDDDGDFSNPYVIANYVTGPQIMQAIFNNSIDTTAGGGGPPPGAAEGPLFLDLGSFETGGMDLTGAPVDWPMTIAQIASLMTSTGELDLVITPTDPGGGVMGTIDAYNGDYGIDLSGSVIFQYGMGNYSVRALRWNEDMSNICNKLYYFLGPKIDQQHWTANVQGDDGKLYGNILNPYGALSGGPFADHGRGGALTTSASYDAPATLGPARETSQSDFGVRMDIKIFDGEGTNYERWLYRRLWQIEISLRNVPRQIIHVTPIRGYPLGTFDIGDLVTVEATSTVRGGFSGAQRVYGYTISWDEDGPLSLGEIQTSADNEGFGD